MKKLVVYTALFTDEPDYLYGDIIHYNHDKEGVDYVCYTNSEHLKSDFWEIRKMDVWRDGRWTARKCKTSPDKLLPDYDAWLWMDSQIYFRYDARSLFEYYLGDDYDLAVHKHCDRNCLYEETYEGGLKRVPLRDDPAKLVGQVKRYEQEGYPHNSGMYENGILFRRNTEEVVKMNDLWFKEVADWNTEDMQPMMYSLWKHKEVRVNAINKTFVEHYYKNRHLELSDHFATLPRQKTYVGGNK
tara:strand:- start:2537 stop:3265 length:729 start_codon:yes stop_codon:yes gene_type:complete